MHCGVTIFILHVNVGALGHQQLDQVGVALRHRQLQRRLVAVVADVYIAASLWKGSKKSDQLSIYLDTDRKYKCFIQFNLNSLFTYVDWKSSNLLKNMKTVL